MRGLVGALALLSALVAPVAAQSNPEAEQAFRDGKQHMVRKDYDAACAAFAVSDRLEPNVATRLSLADCYEKRGKLASAWGLFLSIASQTRDRPDDAAIHAVALSRTSALEPRLSYLTISVPATSAVAGLSIERDGTAVDPGLWNRAMPIDRGTYVVRAHAPGREPWSTTVVIDADAIRRTVDVPRFDQMTLLRGSASTDAIDEGVAGSTAPHNDRRQRSRLWSIGLGAGAITLAGVATGFELAGRSAYDDYRASPDGPARDDQLADANGKHHIAQVTGLVALGCGVASAVVWHRGSRHSGAPRVAIVPILGGEDLGVGVWSTF